MRKSEYASAAFISILVHAAAIFLIAGYASLSGCMSPKEELIPVDFTVAVESAPDAPETFEPEAVEPPPPPEPQAVEPPPPPPPPPDPDPVVEKKQPEKKPDPPKKTEPKKEEKKAEAKPKKPEIKKGRRIRGPENHPVTPSTLSPEEIARRLREGARPGQTDSIEPGELQKNFLKIQKALYAAWDKPPRADVRRPVVARIGFDSFGNIVSRKIETSSGNPALDKSVMDALNRVRRVDNLSAKFLASHKSVSIDFEVE